MSEIAIPSTGTAQVHVLHEGYVGLGALKASRDLLRGLATVVIPGHGAPFRPSEHA